MPIPKKVTSFHGKIKVNTWPKDDFYFFRNLLLKEKHRKHKIVLQNTNVSYDLKHCSVVSISTVQDIIKTYGGLI
jgi:hypothetical protein